MNYILFVTNEENFKIFNKMGVVGFKLRRRREAEKTKPGDLLTCYIAGIGKIGGIVKIESEMYEGKEKIFKEKTPGEMYPFRFKCSTVMELPAEKWIPIEDFKKKLEIFKKRAGPHWKLALQGQVHYLSEGDFVILQSEIEKAK